MNRLMADRLGGGLSILLLTVLTAVAWMLAELSATRSTASSISAPDTPKANLRSVRLTQSDASGASLYTINAESGEQVQDGRITLRQPALKRTRQDANTTEMRSGKGELSPNQELVRLSEGVKATQITNGSRQDRLELETSELLVLTQEERASSTKDVRIQQGGRVLTGKGLELDLKTGQYRVLSQARVEIKP